MNVLRFWGKMISSFQILRSNASPSFSQSGEDQIIRYLFEQLRIRKPTYLDIGTSHPVLGNNTYLFYTRGSSGVCVEPNPAMYRRIVRKRGRDKVLNVGVGLGEHSEADLYMFPSPYTGWNTFSEEQADYYQKESGVKVSKVMKIQMKDINSIIEANFSGCPNLISIDVEGMDLAILKTLDFSRFKPEVICAETITFSTNLNEQKLTDIHTFLSSKGYFLFADSHINSIFCRSDLYGQQS